MNDLLLHAGPPEGIVGTIVWCAFADEDGQSPFFPTLVECEYTEQGEESWTALRSVRVKRRWALVPPACPNAQAFSLYVGVIYLVSAERCHATFGEARAAIAAIVQKRIIDLTHLRDHVLSLSTPP